MAVQMTNVQVREVVRGRTLVVNGVEVTRDLAAVAYPGHTGPNKPWSESDVSTIAALMPSMCKENGGA